MYEYKARTVASVFWGVAACCPAPPRSLMEMNGVRGLRLCRLSCRTATAARPVSPAGARRPRPASPPPAAVGLASVCFVSDCLHSIATAGNLAPQLRFQSNRNFRIFKMKFKTKYFANIDRNIQRKRFSLASWSFPPVEMLRQSW